MFTNHVHKNTETSGRETTIHDVGTGPGLHRLSCALSLINLRLVFVQSGRSHMHKTPSGDQVGVTSVHSRLITNSHETHRGVLLTATTFQVHAYIYSLHETLRNIGGAYFHSGIVHYVELGICCIGFKSGPQPCQFLMGCSIVLGPHTMCVKGYITATDLQEYTTQITLLQTCRSIRHRLHINMLSWRMM